MLLCALIHQTVWYKCEAALPGSSVVIFCQQRVGQHMNQAFCSVIHLQQHCAATALCF